MIVSPCGRKTIPERSIQPSIRVEPFEQCRRKPRRVAASVLRQASDDGLGFGAAGCNIGEGFG
jgi:hypothetical protein